MKIEGGCHCGYIAYEAEVDPDKVRICHCTDCQTLSGSAFRTVAFTNPGSFNLRSGEVADLCEDRRERKQAAAVVLPEMRHADLFGLARRRSQQGAFAKGRIGASARSAGSERTILDAIVAALA